MTDITMFNCLPLFHGLQASVTGVKALPVRPGMFLETVSKVLVAYICGCGLYK